MPGDRIRVLVADDSPTMASYYEEILTGDPSIELVGSARNGKDAVDLATQQRPDLVIMDIVMPKMDGLLATQLIMSRAPTPILVISSCIDPCEQTITLNALNAGAVAALAKPQEILGADGEVFANLLLTHVRQFSRVRVRTQPSLTGPVQPVGPAPVVAGLDQKSQYQVVGIGASVGGPTALFNFIAHFPPSFALPIVVVQHLAPGLLPALITWLHENTGRIVEVAKDGETIVGRSILFAPDGKHLTITSDLRVKLSDEAPVAERKPSIDVLFHSMAQSLGNRCIGVLLAMVGEDGTAGLGELKAGGAPTFAQDESSSVIVGLTSGARPAVPHADKVLPPGEMAREILRLTRPAPRA